MGDKTYNNRANTVKYNSGTLPGLEADLRVKSKGPFDEVSVTLTNEDHTFDRFSDPLEVQLKVEGELGGKGFSGYGCSTQQSYQRFEDGSWRVERHGYDAPTEVNYGGYTSTIAEAERTLGDRRQQLQLLRECSELSDVYEAGSAEAQTMDAIAETRMLMEANIYRRDGERTKAYNELKSAATQGRITREDAEAQLAELNNQIPKMERQEAYNIVMKEIATGRAPRVNLDAISKKIETEVGDCVMYNGPMERIQAKMPVAYDERGFDNVTLEAFTRTADIYDKVRALHGDTGDVMLSAEGRVGDETVSVTFEYTPQPDGSWKREAKSNSSSCSGTTSGREGRDRLEVSGNFPESFAARSREARTFAAILEARRSGIAEEGQRQYQERDRQREAWWAKADAGQRRFRRAPELRPRVPVSSIRN